MPGIFVSYRRQDSSGWALHLFGVLKDRFEKDEVFMDIANIEAGVDFTEAIAKAVDSCGVMLVLIGPNWLTSKNVSGQRRLDDPNDFIRLEITHALARKIPVIPVLLGGAPMPVSTDLPEALGPLVNRQALELSDSRWDFDAERLIRVLEDVLRQTASGFRLRHWARFAWKVRREVPPAHKKARIKAVACFLLMLTTILAGPGSHDEIFLVGKVLIAIGALALAISVFQDTTWSVLKWIGIVEVLVSVLLVVASFLLWSSYMAEHTRELPDSSPAAEGQRRLPKP